MRCAPALVIALAFACAAALAAKAEELDSAVGKALFDRQWVQAPASTDALRRARAAVQCQGVQFLPQGWRRGAIDRARRRGDHARAGGAHGKCSPASPIPSTAISCRIAPYRASCRRRGSATRLGESRIRHRRDDASDVAVDFTLNGPALRRWHFERGADRAVARRPRSDRASIARCGAGARRSR